jgi:hypothetical protein
MSKDEEKTETAWHKGEPVKLTMTDWVGALTRGDPEWSARPPPQKERAGIDRDRRDWLKKRKEQG